MANTYHQMYLQTVFAVKHKNALIQNYWKTELFAVIGNLINESGSKTILINGVEDHVHCFFGLKPTISVSDLMKSVKAKSSKWINENNLLAHRFDWQAGFGSFSYSHSHIDKVYQYIKNQEEHHKKVSFLREYRQLLQKFGIEYNEKYIFHEPRWIVVNPWPKLKSPLGITVSLNYIGHTYGISVFLVNLNLGIKSRATISAIRDADFSIVHIIYKIVLSSDVIVEKRWR